MSALAHTTLTTRRRHGGVRVSDGGRSHSWRRGVPALLVAMLMIGGCACSASSSGNHADASALAPADGAPGSAQPSVSAAAGPSSAAAVASSAASAAPEADFREAARLLEYDTAYSLLMQLPASELTHPKMRLAMGRLALLSGHHAEAVAALTGLEAELPQFADEISQWRTAAAAVAGPHEEAAAKLATSARVRDLLLGAEAYLRADKPGEARKLVDTAVKRAQRTRRSGDEAHGHALRAKIAEQTKKTAVAAADWRWLIEHGRDSERVRAAIAGLDRVKGSLSVRERADALARTATADNLKATLDTLTALLKKHPQDRFAIDMAVGQAHYRARDYAGANTAFDAVASSGSPLAAEAKYYAARCADRLGKATDAINRYAGLASVHRRNVWAERGSYRHAELLLLNGRYQEAAGAFASYLARFKRTEDTEAARYGRALALLSGGQPKVAQGHFRALRKKANDRRFRARLQHLEGVAAARAGDLARARKLWLDLIADQPLTWPAMAAHARLKAIAGEAAPPQIGPAANSGYLPLAVTLPPAVALLHELGLDEDAERRLTAVEQSAAERYPNRESEALCQLYGQLSGAQRRQRLANRAVALSVLMRPPSSADRWAWQCTYPFPFANVVQAAEQNRELPHGLVHAVMRQESAFATTAVSPVGARGLMQLMPKTASLAAAEAQLPFESHALTRPRQNIGLGAFYLGKLQRNFKGSLPLTVAAYNAGPKAVQRWLQASTDRDADVWVARIPYRETREYAERVLSNLARYQYLAGGVEAVTPFSLQLPEVIDIGPDAY